MGPVVLSDMERRTVSMSFEPSALTGRPDFDERIHEDDPFLDQDTEDWTDHATCSGCRICTSVFDDLKLHTH